MLHGFKDLNHFNAVPVKVGLTDLYIQSSNNRFQGMDAWHIRCLYIATCSVGLVHPSYVAVSVGRLSFSGSLAFAIFSTNGDTANMSLLSMMLGVRAPGNWDNNFIIQRICLSINCLHSLYRGIFIFLMFSLRTYYLSFSFLVGVGFFVSVEICAICVE